MKLTYSFFNPKTGESVVTLTNRYGSYTGKAKLHPDDINNISKFTGCRLAERRAYIKYLQSERRRYKNSLKTIQNTFKDLQINCPDSIDEKIEKRINILIHYHTKNINEIDEAIDHIKNLIKEEIKVREKILKSKVKK